eukprot:scaffold93671_cov63-Phaeocystis_antarctica.AAC.3
MSVPMCAMCVSDCPIANLYALHYRARSLVLCKKVHASSLSTAVSAALKPTSFSLVAIRASMRVTTHSTQ